MKNIYIALSRRLKSIEKDLNQVDSTGTSGLVKHIDIYKAQPEFREDNAAFYCPAIFIEFKDIQWQDLGKGRQLGTANIRFHIVQDYLQDSYQSQNTAENENQEALQILDTIDKVYVALQRFPISSDTINCTPLTRTRSISDTRHDTVTVDILEFQTTITCEKAVPIRTQGVVENVTHNAHF